MRECHCQKSLAEGSRFVQVISVVFASGRSSILWKVYATLEKKQKTLLEERIKEREAMTRRELIALSHNSKKMRGALRKKLDKIEYVQGTKIA